MHPTLFAFPFHFRLGQQARNEYFGQAIVGLISPNSIISEDRVKHTVDFLTVHESELLKVIEIHDLSHLEPTCSKYFLFVLTFQFEVPLRFTISTTSMLHGLGCWFDIQFTVRRVLFLIVYSSLCALAVRRLSVVRVLFFRDLVLV